MKGWLAAVLAAILGAVFFYRKGNTEGARDARVEGLEEKEELLNEIADKELEVKLAEPLGDRLSGLRDRIGRRRGGSDS